MRQHDFPPNTVDNVAIVFVARAVATFFVIAEVVGFVSHHHHLLPWADARNCAAAERCPKGSRASRDNFKNANAATHPIVFCFVSFGVRCSDFFFYRPSTAGDVLQGEKKRAKDI